MRVNQTKSIIFQELEIIENFLTESPDEVIKEGANYIFERVKLNAEKINQTKETHLEPRWLAVLNKIKKYLNANNSDGHSKNAKHYKCYICGNYLSNFSKFNNVGSDGLSLFVKNLDWITSDLDNMGCVYCSCHDRERHLFAYFDRLNLWARESDKVLHFAPETHLCKKIESRRPLEYIKADFEPELYINRGIKDVRKIDLMNIPFNDNYFDIVMCCHILEHVPNLEKGLSEIYRVLKKGGFAILQTPFSRLLHNHFEDSGITTDEQRDFFYGQKDHVRMISEKQFFEDLKKIGFNLEIVRHHDLFDDNFAKIHGVNPKEDLIRVIKNAKKSKMSEAKSIVFQELEAVEKKITKSPEEEIKIFVAYHKPWELPSESIYVPIHSGRKMSPFNLEMLGDDTGDNISDKNALLSEFTAWYWVWKNAKKLYPNLEYIGLAHYRRYFAMNTSSWNSVSVIGLQKIPNMNYYDELFVATLKEVDIILIKPIYFGCSAKQQYSDCHYESDLMCVKEIIHEMCPEYDRAFEEVFFDRTGGLSLFGMFVSKYELFDKYFEWLFPLMFEAERRIDVSNYNEYQTRVLAFLAERLLNVYVHHHNLKRAYVPAYWIVEEGEKLFQKKPFQDKEYKMEGKNESQSN